MLDDARAGSSGFTRGWRGARRLGSSGGAYRADRGTWLRGHDPTATATGGVMDRQHTGGEIQRLDGVGTLQTPRMSWSPQGVLALAALEAARRNGELDAWRRDRALPERALPGPIGKAA